MIRLLGAPALLALAACAPASDDSPAAKFLQTDACTLLASGDAGRLSGTPKQGGRACDYTFDSLTVKLTLLPEKFADASKPLQPDGGYGAVVGDRPMTRRCTDASGTVTCDAVVEVRDGQLVGLKVVQRSHDANAVGQATQGLALKAVERLPK